MLKHLRIPRTSSIGSHLYKFLQVLAVVANITAMILLWDLPLWEYVLSYVAFAIALVSVILIVSHLIIWYFNEA